MWQESSSTACATSVSDTLARLVINNPPIYRACGCHIFPRVEFILEEHKFINLQFAVRARHALPLQRKGLIYRKLPLLDELC
jgi:hypothetical protein